MKKDKIVPPKKQICYHCVWWHHKKPSYKFEKITIGTCRHDSPSPVGWPKTHKDDWCRHWRNKAGNTLLET